MKSVLKVTQFSFEMIYTLTSSLSTLNARPIRTGVNFLTKLLPTLTFSFYQTCRFFSFGYAVKRSSTVPFLGNRKRLTKSFIVKPILNLFLSLQLPSRVFLGGYKLTVYGQNQRALCLMHFCTMWPGSTQQRVDL